MHILQFRKLRLREGKELAPDSLVRKTGFSLPSYFLQHHITYQLKQTNKRTKLYNSNSVQRGIIVDVLRGFG